jgi:hypothetical protein
VADNVARALADALTPSVIRIIALVCSRRPLLDRLRVTTPAGIPLLAEITRMIAGYLTAERGLGRIALEDDVDARAGILVGAAHLLAAGRDDPSRPDDLRAIVTTAIDCVTHEPPGAPARAPLGEGRVT